VATLIAAYGVFAAGFIMRPIGSGVFCWMGDTIGRSRTMLISVILKVVPPFFLSTADACGEDVPEWCR
jgi:MHS family proline/betaine transporter-like MFS transporter